MITIAHRMFPAHRQFKQLFFLGLVVLLAACKSSGGLIAPADETADAAAIVVEANKDLKGIKVLYEKNEGKREELKKAMQAEDAAAVRKISDDVVYIINDGAALGKSALEKIDKARELNVNSDYAEYLRLKWEALNKQLEAFEEYRQAARKLRDSYDPKNEAVRATVTAEFKERSEAFQKLMEKARDYSSEANELAKEVQRQKVDQ